MRFIHLYLIGYFLLVVGAILALWQASSPSPQNTIAAYLHRYVNGTVVDIGVMSSDAVDQDVSVQFFLVSSIEDFAST